MANTGVLPFVRGIDFSNNDFEVSINFLQLVNKNILAGYYRIYNTA